MSTPPQIECDRHHPTYQVSDVNATIDFYTNKLGFTLGFTWGEGPHMAGLNLGEVSIHVIRGKPNPEGHEVYFIVGDADELFEFQKNNGVEVLLPPTDQIYEIRDYRVREAAQIYLSPLGLTTEALARGDAGPLTSDLAAQMQGHHLEVEAIIAGHDETAAHIYHVAHNGFTTCHDDIGFVSIGIGASHADSWIMSWGFANR